MMLSGLRDLTPAKFQAVIINVSTKLVSTLAVLSTLRNADMPVLLIDCESTDGSVDHFSSLMQTHPFDILAAPLRKHGKALDWLFVNAPAENLLLVDSDLEILDCEIIQQMKGAVQGPDVFGAGFVHGPDWLGKADGMPDRIGLYQERMWIPLTLLSVSHIRRAIASGVSFVDRRIFNDFPEVPWLSRLASLRLRLPVVRHWRLSAFERFRRVYHGRRPNFVFCDTGAEVYGHLKDKCGLTYASLPLEHWTNAAHHFHGVTRRKIKPGENNATVLDDVSDKVRQRLRDEYSVEV